MHLPRPKKSRVVVVLLVLAAVVSAFAVPRNFGGPVTAMPTTAIDDEVTSLLPIGPHTVTITYLPDGDRRGFLFNESAGSGYIDLPAGYDLTDSCSYDIRLDDRADDVVGTTEYRKSLGRPAWERFTPEGGEALPWVSDEVLAPGILPPGMALLVVMDVFMEHTWCEFRRLDQVTRLDPSTPGLLVPDREALIELDAARYDAYATKAIEAADRGFLSRSRSRNNVRWHLESDFHFPNAESSLFPFSVPRVTREGERVVMRFYLGKRVSGKDPVIEIVFTPTERREIRDVAEEFPDAETYWEKVAANKSGLSGGLHGEAWLNTLEGLRWLWLMETKWKIDEFLGRCTGIC
jgi:hypothetical protein